MNRCQLWLASAGLTALLLALFSGCSQPDDVLIDYSNTDFYLESMENFPSSYEGMIYELWVAGFEDTVSAGKFGYDNITREFLDESGNIRTDSNLFHIDSDFFTYRAIFISVEKYPDADLMSPSAIMLIDDATDPEEDALRLIFPEVSDTLPLWSAIARYNMESTSDDSTYIKTGPLKVIINTRDSASNGFGLWFANYQRRGDSLRDTTRADSIIPTLTIKDIEKDTTIISVKAVSNIRVEVIARIFGLDTLQQTVVRFDSIMDTSTTNPHAEWILNLYVETVPDISEPPRTLEYDLFTQDEFRLPDFTSFGWTYKAWIVSPHLDKNVFGAMNPPGWRMPYNDTVSNYYLIPGDYGGIISLGTFATIDDKNNDPNLYTLTDRVPPVPGDDLFQNLPGASSPINLIPGSGNNGTVFITLEPLVLQGNASATNFPLFVLIDDLPTLRTQVTEDDQSFSMRNWTGSSDPGRGFPKVKVSITRY